MNSIAKIKQLEKKYKEVKRKLHGETVLTRYVNTDGQSIDKDGNLLSEAEIARLKKEEEGLGDDDFFMCITMRSD